MEYSTKKQNFHAMQKNFAFTDITTKTVFKATPGDNTSKFVCGFTLLSHFVNSLKAD